MTDLTFPSDFYWGTATAPHQVEGDNTNSDWWAWERHPRTTCAEPSGLACDHYHRFRDDMALLRSLGFNSYRFGVEWARVEPSEGTFDEAELAHYREMVEACRENGLEPMVTLYHFTIPQWLAGHGGWLSPKSPALFERYTRRVVDALGDAVTWYATINESSTVATGGYLGRWGFPPDRTNYQDWTRVRRALVAGHLRSRDAIRDLRPDAKVGQTIAMTEYTYDEGGRALVEAVQEMNEDPYLEASADDDWIGVQTYTRNLAFLPRIFAPAVRAAARDPLLRRLTIPAAMRTPISAKHEAAPGAKLTQMGWEYRPQAIAWTVRRVASIYPDKDVLVTEHGVATENDDDRVAFIAEGLAALHDAIHDGIHLRGYVHWSAVDNFEWAKGYAPKFGLIAVDRTTMERTPKPSARFLGEVARTGRLSVPDAASTDRPPTPTRSGGVER